MTQNTDIPLFILGLLRRHGPQHGYQINKLFVENIADFARIKLPTIYYHLERLASGGFLEATPAKDTTRPERTVYALTSRGEERFIENLRELTEIAYEPAFRSDALLYFADSLPPSELSVSLNRYIDRMTQAIETIDQHEAAARTVLPDEGLVWASALFDHHRSHYRTEAQWAQRTIESLKLQRNHKENEK